MRLSLRYSGVMTTILLTGSSRGIGAAAKASLEARGAKVIGQATSSKAVDTVPADFCEPGAPHELWEAALARTGGEIDVLINNAGLFDPNPLDRSDIEWLDAWEDTMRINLTASAQLSRFAVKHWQERGFPGRIVHVASRAGHRGDSPAHWHYAASKGGCWPCTRPSPANMHIRASSALPSRPDLRILQWRAITSKAVAVQAFLPLFLLAG